MPNQSLDNLVRMTADIASKVSSPDRPPRVIATHILKLYRLGKSLHKRYENACSYEWATGPKYEAYTEKLEERARALGAEIGLAVEHQRDPRGAPIKLRREHDITEWAVF